jgi:hypothetical protein
MIVRGSAEVDIGRAPELQLITRPGGDSPTPTSLAITANPRLRWHLISRDRFSRVQGCRVRERFVCGRRWTRVNLAQSGPISMTQGWHVEGPASYRNLDMGPADDAITAEAVRRILGEMLTRGS